MVSASASSSRALLITRARDAFDDVLHTFLFLPSSSRLLTKIIRSLSHTTTPYLRTVSLQITQEESIPTTEEDLAKRRAAALRRWLENEMGEERASLTALLAKHGVKMRVSAPHRCSSYWKPIHQLTPHREEVGGGGMWQDGVWRILFFF